MPDESWWIALHVVHEITGISFISCKSLNGHGLLLCNQHIALNRLFLEISSKFGIAESLLEMQRSAIAEATHEPSDSGEYALSLAAVRDFVKDMGFFVKVYLVTRDKAGCDTLLRMSANAILVLVDDISAIVAEPTEENEAYLDAAPVFCPISLSAFDPATCPTIRSVTRSVSISPSASRRLRISGANTKPCASHTATGTM